MQKIYWNLVWRTLFGRKYLGQIGREELTKIILVLFNESSEDKFTYFYFKSNPTQEEQLKS